MNFPSALFVPALVPAVLLVAAALPAQEAAKIKLEVTAKKGDSAAFVSRSVQEQQIDMGGQQMDAGNEVTHDFSVEVTGVGEDGTLTATVVIQRVRGKFTLPMMGEIEFDTKAPADGKPADDAGDDAGFGMPSAASLRKAMSAITGKSFTAKVKPTGKVEELGGLAEALQAARKNVGGPGGQMLGNALSESTFLQLVRSAFGPFPAQPVGVGDNWPGDETDAGSKEMPMDRKTTMTLAKADADAVEFKIQGTLASKAAGEGQQAEQRMMQDAKIENGKIEGTIAASRKDGFVVRAESKVTMDITASSPMGEMKIGIKNTVTLERGAPAKDAKDAEGAKK